MRGQMLLPLSELQFVFPDIYKLERQKYAEREFIMEQRIPYLDCSWNDVLHLTAVPPRLLELALRKVGIRFRREFFAIESEIIAPSRAIVYLNNQSENSNKMEPNNFAPFIPAQLHKYAELPTNTVSYYQRMKASGRRPLLFHGVPHILYRGAISVATSEIITVCGKHLKA
jgi:hypothetical protein